MLYSHKTQAATDVMMTFRAPRPKNMMAATSAGMRAITTSLISDFVSIGEVMCGADDIFSIFFTLIFSLKSF